MWLRPLLPRSLGSEIHAALDEQSRASWRMHSLCWSCCRFSTSSGVRLLLHGCVRNWYSSESQRDSSFCCILCKIVQRLILWDSFGSFGQQNCSRWTVLNRRCCVGQSMHAYADPDLAAVRSMIPQRTNLSMPLFSSIARLSSFPVVLSTSVA